MEEISTGITQVVSFRLGEEEFGVHIAQVQEIIRLQAVTALPRVPHYIEGVINLRGKIVPVLDLRKKFSMEEGHRTKEGRIIVATLEGETIGFVVDAASDVLRINMDAIEAPPPILQSVGGDYIEGVVNIEDRLLLILNLPKVLNRDEARKN
ncbi:MAG: chemotaxis protein CheW [Armatimonadetes bacterium]|nr:chemotaxis protein CheW [Armatimonadota bacterium]